MPRPQTFERSEVLEKAMHVFWAQGYEATSIEDLAQATGLARQSMYNTFGDKHAFFLETLKLYQDMQGQRMLGVLTTSRSVKEGFRRLFETIVDDAVSEIGCRGCMMVNTVTELAAHDAQIKRFADVAEAKKEDVFAEAIRRGQASGEISLEKDADALAKFLYNAVLGLRVRSTRTPEREGLETIVEMTLEVLE